MKICFRILFVLLVWAASFTVQAAPDPEDLMDEKWLEARSPHFHVVTDAKEEIALRVAQDLENFRFFIGSILQVDLVEGLPPVKVLAMYHKSNFKDLGLPDNWAGVFQQTVDGAYAIANISRYELDTNETNWGKHTLLHEYVHYVNQNNFAQLFYPLWYSEGMAEYLATFKYKNNEIRFGSVEALAGRVYALDYKWGQFKKIDLEDLFKTRRINTVSEKRSDTKAVHQFYARAAAVVHYLNSSKENRKSASDYIRMINEGYDIDFAFKRSFSRGFQDLEKEVLDYLNSDKLVVRKLTADGAFKFPAVDIKVSPLAVSDSSYHIADFLMRFYESNKIGFDPIMNLMKRSLETDPENIEKKLLIANMLFVENQKHHEESRRILKEILAKRPDYPAALALYGDILHREAVTHLQVGLPGWEQAIKEARNQYRKAIKHDPFNGRAYYGLAISHIWEINDKPADEAFAVLDSARFFSPNQELLWQEALMRLRTHDNEKAIPLLRRYIATGGNYVAIPRALLDLQELRLLPKMQVENPVPGRYVYTDGSSYEGGWKNAMPEGKGTLIRPNGVKYAGFWKNGLIHGEGEFLSSNENKYVMQFKNGEATGSGAVSYPNGSYKGELLNGIIHGKGETLHKSGARHVGGYWHTLYHGPGVFNYAGETAQQMEWIFGKIKIQLSEDLTYVGAVKQGKPHGPGLCINKKSHNKVERCWYTDGIPGQAVASEEAE